ncbi:MAG: translocation/assembly module TamB domain-containing protein, partial [Microcystaceae cyanobacterium]
RLPYLPTSFTIRQGEGPENPIIAQGRRIGDRLIAEVENFPLEILNIVPAVDYGFPGPVAGQLTASVDVNLFTFATSGQVNIERPGIGNLQAESIAANFSYENNRAQLISGVLRIGQSEYMARGNLDLQTGAIQGNLKADRGRIEDVLTTLGIYDLESLVSFFQFKRRDYATAAAVPTNPVGDPNAPIADQVNLLWAIEQRIRALAAQRESGGVPTEVDIRGNFSAEIAVAGTLSNPQVDFQFQGNNWSWRPQLAYPAIVEPVGLVKQEASVIPIDKVLLQGNFAGGVVQVQPALVQIGDATLSFAGKLSPQNSSATFAVDNLSMDTVAYFVKLPVDIAGKINASGNLSGNLTNPKITGQVAFVEGAISGRSLEQDVVGNFDYVDSR